jgi:hypothetical protein
MVATITRIHSSLDFPMTDLHQAANCTQNNVVPMQRARTEQPHSYVQCS